MAEPAGNLRCTITCWLIGLLAGILAVVLLRLIGDLSWPGAIFTGGVLTVVLGLLLSIILCRPLPTLDEVQARHARSVPAGVPGSNGAVQPAAPAAMATPAATATPAPVPPVPASVPPTPESEPVQEAAPEPEPEPQPGPEPEASPEPAPDTATAAPAGPATEADKPAMLDGPRDGGADNLKEIKGVGPKLEALLNRLGVYHFDQIAGWTDREIAWVDENLEGFKGRVSRDDWVAQAKVLAGGGETEFSKRVEDGGVY